MKECTHTLFRFCGKIAPAWIRSRHYCVMASIDSALMQKIADDFWQWKLRESPEFATMCNIHTYNDRLESLSISALEGKVRKCEAVLQSLYQVKTNCIQHPCRIEPQPPAPYNNPVFTSQQSNFIFPQVKRNNLSIEERKTYKQLYENVSAVVDGFRWRYHGACNIVNFLENLPIAWSSFVVFSTRFASLDDFEMYAKRLSVSGSYLNLAI